MGLWGLGVKGESGLPGVAWVQAQQAWPQPALMGPRPGFLGRQGSGSVSPLDPSPSEAQ